MLTPLLSPRAGTPEISADESSFEKVIKSLLAGNGPIQLMQSELQVIATVNGLI